MADAPHGLHLERHRDLERLGISGIVVRRIGYTVLALILLLGLLNFFGQRPSITTRDAPAAKLELYAPSHLRSGLLFTARFTVAAKEDLKDATLVLDRGWVESMAVNTIEPSPVGEASRDGRLALELGHIPAGHSFVLFMQFQVNPTNVTRRSQDVELLDGNTHITSIDRTLTVFP